MLLWERMNRMMFHGTDGNESMQNVQLAFEMLQKINVLYSWGLNEMWIEHFIKLLTDSMGLVYTSAPIKELPLMPNCPRLLWCRRRVFSWSG